MKASGKPASREADQKSDVKLVRSGVHQHERNMHKGKAETKLKLGKTGASGHQSR